MVMIAPSVLSADILHLAKEIQAIEHAGADLIHIDVMDGHFVKNLTFGPLMVEAIKKITHLPLDVHLMIDAPSSYVETYIKSGADLLTVHAESCVHLDRCLEQIRSLGAKAGVALNPSTNESALSYVLDKLDLVLVMSVNPGFSGQEFLKSSLKKIEAIRSMLKEAGNHRCMISVDGGISDKTAGMVKKAGADCLVSGSFIWDSADYKKAIASLRDAV